MNLGLSNFRARSLHFSVYLTTPVLPNLSTSCHKSEMLVHVFIAQWAKWLRLLVPGSN